MHKRDPILISSTGMILSILASLTILSIWKPKFITEEVINDSGEKEEKLHWGKFVSLSLVFGIVTGIVLYLSFMGRGRERGKIMVDSLDQRKDPVFVKPSYRG